MINVNLIRMWHALVEFTEDTTANNHPKKNIDERNIIQLLFNYYYFIDRRKERIVSKSESLSWAGNILFSFLTYFANLDINN